ncbi:hypothetical protein PYCCODRAFT_1457237 [Trametes coccinea BRFM310]|uniref:C2H2-type domain-containing protein n=1 Tax=Trametes coccinea (strain BRFM310) TaxID=1353009 RepID=A0A1Y2IXC2_TRAC3|nr:hypothetical protein PYCCODRAFT_1457237 [Trametes coccinea BRFM310]
MHNVPSPSDYMFKTPQAPSHAPYTPPGFSLGFPPHDHAVYLQSGPSNYSALPGAPARSGYPYASSSCTAPPAAYPATPPGYRGYQHKAPGQNPLTEPDEPTMAISLARSSRLQPATTATTSSSDTGGNGSGSDGGREPTPPSSQERPRDVKKKTHHCWMCHKSFDRPSTLKKHLLVHTGEKAFACESCGRRFGVASNLNRHAKTCRAAAIPGPAGTPGASSSSPVASTSQPAVASPTSSDESTAVVTPAPPVEHPTETPTPRRSTRKRKAPSTEESNTPEMTSDRQSRSRKRARRAPSPVLWIPDSLKAFDLTPLTKGTPVPLPPVRPFQESNQVEERDSFDENASVTPYHPRGWKGRLPGPGLLGNNVANRGGGQLLIF